MELSIETKKQIEVIRQAFITPLIFKAEDHSVCEFIGKPPYDPALWDALRYFKAYRAAWQGRDCFGLQPNVFEMSYPFAKSIPPHFSPRSFSWWTIPYSTADYNTASRAFVIKVPATYYTMSMNLDVLRMEGFIRVWATDYGAEFNFARFFIYKEALPQNEHNRR